MKSKSPLIAAVVLSLTAASSSQAAISIVGTPVEGFLASDRTKVGTSHSVNLVTTPSAEVSYDATGASKLVVAISTEAGNNGQIVNSMTVAFNGTPMTLAARDNTVVDSVAGGNPADFDGGYAGIFYLDNPFQGSGTFTISTSTTSGTPNGGHLTILGLSGTAAGIGNTTAQRASQTTSPVSSSIITSADNSFVMAMVSNHGNNNSAGHAHRVRCLGDLGTQRLVGIPVGQRRLRIRSGRRGKRFNGHPDLGHNQQRPAEHSPGECGICGRA